MKKCFAILLTAIYLLSATELKQLLKVPVMIQHFHEHRQEDPNISVWSFIVLHYFSGNIKDADYERDQQLPFKQISLQQIQMDVPPLHYPIAHQIPVTSVEFEVKNAFNSPFLMASLRFSPLSGALLWRRIRQDYRIYRFFRLVVKRMRLLMVYAANKRCRERFCEILKMLGIKSSQAP